MRVPLGVRAIVAATAGLAGASFLAALAAGAGLSLTTVALLAALAVVTEYFQVDAVEPPLNPADARTFSFSSGVHIAAVVVAGPAAAALVAVTGVVVLIRGAPLRRVTFNASTFALSALVGGLAFQAAGGTPGEVALPADMPAVAALALVYAFVNGVLVTAVVSAAQGVRFGFDALIADLGTDAAEASLGAALAVFALHEAWALVLLVPLAAATYQAHARLAMLRRQTARSLEVLANVIDERDPYTYRHSQRVSELVGEVAEGIGLPSLVAARLRWAGRHHERWDGQGYYGIERERVPLASHLLTVADTFDAMTSDRPYRAGLPEEDALAEIESQAGSQFHPAVAHAFVAVRRGQDPETVLEAAELAELRSLSFDMPASRRLPEAAATLAVVVSVEIVLVGLGTGMPIVAGVGAAGAIALVGLRHAGGQR